MEHRQFGTSGLRVPALSFGICAFGGRGPLSSAWGQSEAAETRRLIDICLDAGMTLFDTADVHPGGVSEGMLGEAVRGRRDRVLPHYRNPAVASRKASPASARPWAEETRP